MQDVVIIEDYARQSHTDMTFVNQLGEIGLIEIFVHEQKPCIPSQQLPLLEKYARMHYDLDINMEGIEAISYLLQRLETLQSEAENMRRQLRMFGSL